MPRYLTTNDTPGRHAPSWYAATTPEGASFAPLAGETRADVCVVGGGFAGLSAALHLAERGYDVALLEANRVGWGASGRNGGQLGTGPRADIDEYEDALGLDDARKVWAMSLEATALVRRLIATHAIDCDLTDGALEVAWKPAHADGLRAYAEMVATRYDYDGYTALDRAAVRERLDTTRYHGGLASRDGGHLNPLAYARGLARAAAAAGARLHEESLVTRVAPGRVETAGGAVAAEHIVLAMNGYLDGLVPAVAARSMPINNFVVATEPMGEARARALIRDPVCVADTKFVLDYFRITSDTRMLWGGGESYSARFPRDIAGLVRSKMLRIFPQLADLSISHAWGGTLAITLTRFPAFQRLPGGILSVSGWSGSGIHMGSFGGLLAAEAVAGQAERFDLLARAPTPRFPGGDWLRSPLLAAAMTWYGLRDRL